MLVPAETYNPAADVGVVACYFSSAGFATKRANFDRFVETLTRSRLEHVVVECAFGDAPFELTASERLVQVRARDVMWQKERLLNLAVARLPARCTTVAWLDADVLFTNADWARETSRLLDDVPIVQPYAQVVRLPRGRVVDDGCGERWPSFGAVYRSHPDRVLCGDFARHGHTGFAWAARRAVIERHGLYDACISGSGDHMMAHAFAGDWSSPCMDRILRRGSAHHANFARWCKAIYPDVRARVGHVSGALLHLWHGETENRRYVLRNQELAAFDFDPERDLRVGPTGAWEWASAKPALHAWAVEYYPSRREDGG
jgi:hypothetical protein